MAQTASSSLSAEVVRAESAEASLASDLSSEVVRATSVEAVISSDLSAEVVRATSVESVISSDLSAEVVRATSVESVISSDLSAEVVRATSVEAVISSDLSTEVSRAESAETSLGVRIDNLLSNIAPEVIDSISEVLNTFYQKVTCVGDVDGTNVEFTPSTLLNDGSESVFLNGVLQDRGTDYTVTLSNGKVSMVTFVDTPQTGDKVNVYGITNVSSDNYINA